MSNIILGYPNRASSAAFAGGSWAASLPVANLANRELTKVARSTNTLLASTKFTIDLGSIRALRCFALVNHNLSQAAKWKLSLGSTPGAADIYTSGFVTVWGMSFDGLIEWESASWWLGVAGDEYLRSPYAALLALPDFANARYLTVEISDVDNIDGYVQVGRFFAGNAVQPTYNASYGLQDSWRDLSTVEEAESGSVWATARRRLRNVSFVLGWLTPTEAAYLHELQRMVGTIDEVLYIPYPHDMGESQRYGFMGRLTELSAIDYPYYRVRSLPLKIEELA